MRSKIFKNILVGNFKKNKNLPLSFMVFLVLGFALILGMFSFLFNFSQALPPEAKSHNKYQYHFWFDKMNINDRDSRNSTFSAADNEKIFNYYLEEFAKAEPHQVVDETWARNFIRELNNTGDGYFANLTNSQIGTHQETVEALGNYMFNQQGIGNFSFLYLNNIFFNQTDFIERKIEVEEYYSYRQYPSDQNEELIYFLTPQTYNLTTYKKAGKDKNNLPPTYRDAEGNLVIYANRTTAQRYHYKIGQKITLPLSTSSANPPAGFTKKTLTYVYGGSMDYTFAMDLGINDNDPIDYYFTPGILNDQGVNQAWKFINHATLTFYNQHTDDMEEYTYAYLATILTTTNVDHFGWISKSYVPLGQLFSSMRMLTLILLAILIILTFALTYYLIREIINSNFNELVTLKTLGISNATLSGINMTEVILLTIIPLLLSLPLSMFIQAIFIRMINGFINLHFTLYDFNLLIIPVIFGLLLVLSLGYFGFSIWLFKRIDLSNGMGNVYGVDFFQRTFSKYYFRVSTDLGINHAFFTKNLSKIVTTLFLEIVIFLFISVVFQFSWSISSGQKTYLKNYAYFDYSSSPTYSLNNNSAVEKPGGGYQNYIDYSMTKKDKQKEITYDNVVNLFEQEPDLTGYFVQRTTADQFIASYESSPFKDENLDLIVKTYKEFIGSYDDLISKYFQVNHYNFEFDFGQTLSDPSQRTAWGTNLNLTNNENGVNIDVFVIDQTSPMYDQVFSKKDRLKLLDPTFNETLHLVISQTTIDWHKLDFKNYANDLWINNDQVASDLLVGEPLVKTAILRNTAFVDRNNLIQVLQRLDDGTFANTLFNLQNNLQNDLVFSEKVPYSFSNIPIRNENLDGTLASYAAGFKALDSYHQFDDLTSLKRQIEYIANRVQPISDSMNILLLISVFIYFLIIIFIVSLIGAENQQIIFIMKAMGYSKRRILFQIASGYSVVILVGLVLAEVIVVQFIGLLNDSFESIIEMTITYSYNYAMIILLLVLTLFSWFVIYYIIAGEIEDCNTATRKE